MNTPNRRSSTDSNGRRMTNASPNDRRRSSTRRNGRRSSFGHNHGHGHGSRSGGHRTSHYAAAGDNDRAGGRCTVSASSNGQTVVSRVGRGSSRGHHHGNGGHRTSHYTAVGDNDREGGRCTGVASSGGQTVVSRVGVGNSEGQYGSPLSEAGRDNSGGQIVVSRAGGGNSGGYYGPASNPDHPDRTVFLPGSTPPRRDTSYGSIPHQGSVPDPLSSQRNPQAQQMLALRPRLGDQERSRLPPSLLSSSLTDTILRRLVNDSLMEYYQPLDCPPPSLQSTPGLKRSVSLDGLVDGLIYRLEDLIVSDFRSQYEYRRFIMGFNDLTEEEQENLMTAGEFLPFDLNYSSPEVQYDLVKDAKGRMKRDRRTATEREAYALVRNALSFANNMGEALADNARTSLDLGFAHADNTRTSLDLGFAHADNTGKALDLGHKAVDNTTLVLQEKSLLQTSCPRNDITTNRRGSIASVHGPNETPSVSATRTATTSLGTSNLSTASTYQSTANVRRDDIPMRHSIVDPWQERDCTSTNTNAETNTAHIEKRDCTSKTNTNPNTARTENRDWCTAGPSSSTNNNNNTSNDNENSTAGAGTTSESTNTNTTSNRTTNTTSNTTLSTTTNTTSNTTTTTTTNTAHACPKDAAELLLLHEHQAAIRLKSERWLTQLKNDGNLYILTQLEVNDQQGSMEIALHYTSEIETLLGKALPDQIAGAPGVCSKMKRAGCFHEELINRVGATINPSRINVAHGRTTELGDLEKANLINNGNIILSDVQRQLNCSNILNQSVIINPFPTFAKQPDWFENDCLWYVALKSTDAALQSTDAALRQSQGQNKRIKHERDEAVKERDEAVKKIKMLEHRLEVYEKSVDTRTRKRVRIEYEQDISRREIAKRQEEEQNRRDREEREQLIAAIESEKKEQREDVSGL